MTSARHTEIVARPVAFYARTHSATSRHIINPARPYRTLCGYGVFLTEYYHDTASGEWRTAEHHMYALPVCQRCERVATSRGIAIPADHVTSPHEEQAGMVFTRDGRFCGEVSRERIHGHQVWRVWVHGYRPIVEPFATETAARDAAYRAHMQLARTRIAS